MKKKRLLFFFFLNLLVGEVMAQFDAMFSQYMDFQEATNPAAIAENDMMNVSGLYKIQIGRAHV